MGLFDDAGINPEELKVDRLAKGQYPGVISNMGIKTGSRPETSDHYFMVFEYSLDEAWPYPIQDWNRILPPGKTLAMCDDVDDSFNVYTRVRDKTVIRLTEKRFFTNAYKTLKRRIMDFGVPEELVNSVGRDQLVGTKVLLTIDEDQNSNFPRLTKVSVPGNSGVLLPGGPPVIGSPPSHISQPQVQMPQVQMPQVPQGQMPQVQMPQGQVGQTKSDFNPNENPFTFTV